MIRHLIMLDFYAMKPLTKFMFPFLLVPIILGVVADLGMSIMVTLTFIVFMLNVVFLITERSNFNKLYGILPIKKSANVLSRYLFSLIVIFTTAIISFVLFIILSVITKGTVNLEYGIQFLAISVFVAILFISIQYPFYFKLEYTKASIMSILPYIVCFAIGIPLINYLMGNQEFYQKIIRIIRYFQSNMTIFVLCVLGLSFLFIVASYLLSKKIQKKEF
nr:ABC-2 transporter permease [uncultured Acetatifactor sp.]